MWKFYKQIMKNDAIARKLKKSAANSPKTTAKLIIIFEKFPQKPWSKFKKTLTHFNAYMDKRKNLPLKLVCN